MHCLGHITRDFVSFNLWLDWNWSIIGALLLPPNLQHLRGFNLQPLSWWLFFVCPYISQAISSAEELSYNGPFSLSVNPLHTTCLQQYPTISAFFSLLFTDMMDYYKQTGWKTGCGRDQPSPGQLRSFERKILPCPCALLPQSYYFPGTLFLISSLYFFCTSSSVYLPFAVICWKALYVWLAARQPTVSANAALILLGVHCLIDFPFSTSLNLDVN